MIILVICKSFKNQNLEMDVHLHIAYGIWGMHDALLNNILVCWLEDINMQTKDEVAKKIYSPTISFALMGFSTENGEQVVAPGQLTLHHNLPTFWIS